MWGTLFSLANSEEPLLPNKPCFFLLSEESVQFLTTDTAFWTAQVPASWFHKADQHKRSNFTTTPCRSLPRVPWCKHLEGGDLISTNIISPPATRLQKTNPMPGGRGQNSGRSPQTPTTYTRLHPAFCKMWGEQSYVTERYLAQPVLPHGSLR